MDRYWKIQVYLFGNEWVDMEKDYDSLETAMIEAETLAKQRSLFADTIRIIKFETRLKVEKWRLHD